MILWMVLVLACGPPPWTEAGSVQGAIRTIGAGSFDEPDWRRVGYGGPSFGEVDTDGSGKLDPPELVAHLRAVDPLHFDDAATRLVPTAGVNLRFFPSTPPQRRVREFLGFVLSELQHRAPGATMPNPALVERAVASGDLEGLEVQMLLRRVRIEARRVGVDLPSYEGSP
jgi:hypothetical protein